MKKSKEDYVITRMPSRLKPAAEKNEYIFYSVVVLNAARYYIHTIYERISWQRKILIL